MNKAQGYSNKPGFFSTSIGRKIIMALSGFALIGFVIAHLAGNLQVFLGPEAINAYAAFLQDNIALLWPARIGLLLIFILHIYTAFKLKLANTSARPNQYKKESIVCASPASLYMLHTGMLIFLFVLVHLAHFTFGMLQPEYFGLHDVKGRHDVYSMAIHGFQCLPYAVFYIICMLALGVHLSHGIASFFQTLGFNHPRYSLRIQCVAKLTAVLIALGYIAIPLSVLFGVLRLPAT